MLQFFAACKLSNTHPITTAGKQMLVFDFFGKPIGIQPNAESWVVFLLYDNWAIDKKTRDIFIPHTVAALDIATYLDDVYHETSAGQVRFLGEIKPD